MSVVESTVSTLWENAEQVLSVAESALAGTTAGAPDLVFTDAGSDPAFDCCPALFVYVDSLNEAETTPNTPVEAPARRVVLGANILARYRVAVLRCAAELGPNGQLPSVEAKMDVARTTNEDVWALWNGLRQAVRDGELFETCLGVHFDGAIPLREQGGCVGWLLTIRANIPGILV